VPSFAEGFSGRQQVEEALSDLRQHWTNVAREQARARRNKRAPVLRGPSFLSFAEYRAAVMVLLNQTTQDWLSSPNPHLARLLTEAGAKTFGAVKFDATSARDFKRSAVAFLEKKAAEERAARQRLIVERTAPWRREVARLHSYKPGLLTPETRRKLKERDERLTTLLRWIEEEEQSG
jgi:hypothetical protein